VNIRYSTALDGYMDDVKSWVGDHTTWETYEEVLSECKEAWLNELNNLPIELDEFDVYFYRALTHWLGMIVDATDVRFNGYKASGRVSADTPFVFIPSSAAGWTHSFQGSLWDIGYASIGLLSLLKPDIAEKFVKGMVELNGHEGKLTAYTNVFSDALDQWRGHVDDSIGFFFILATALSFNLQLDWNSIFEVADTVMTYWRQNDYGGVTGEGYLRNSNIMTMELIFCEYLLSFIASKIGNTAKRDFYRKFALDKNLLSLMYDAEHNRFRIPGTSYDWTEGETDSDRVFWYYSYCSPKIIEEIVDMERYLSDLQYFLDYNNDFNDYQVAAPFIPMLHRRPEITWKNITSIVFPSFHNHMLKSFTIPENFSIPRKGLLYDPAGYEGYTSNLAQYVLQYLGLHYITGYPFFLIGIPQTSYKIGDLHVTVEGHGEYIDSITLNGKPWLCLKLPANLASMSGELKITLTHDPNAWKKKHFILPDNGYYSVTNIEDDEVNGVFKFTIESPVSEDVDIELYFEDQPLSVVGAKEYSYDSETKILKIKASTSSSTEITIYYSTITYLVNLVYAILPMIIVVVLIKAFKGMIKR